MDDQEEKRKLQNLKLCLQLFNHRETFVIKKELFILRCECSCEILEGLLSEKKRCECEEGQLVSTGWAREVAVVNCQISMQILSLPL